MKAEKSGEFVVLLGGDHCGKSSIINTIKCNPEWRVISKETVVADEPTALLKTIEQVFFNIIAKDQYNQYPSDFLLSGFQMILSYMVRQIGECNHQTNVLVDSYYYKVIAKCILRKWINNNIFDIWRAFPQPDKVLFIDSSPYTMWQHSNNGKKSNPFEYYGHDRTLNDFYRFQRDLRDTMLAEITAVPTILIDGNRDLDTIIADIYTHVPGDSIFSPLNNAESFHITQT